MIEPTPGAVINPADLRIMASQFHNLEVKLTDLLPDGIARFEQPV